MHFRGSRKGGESIEKFEERVAAWVETLEHGEGGSIILPLEYPIEFTSDEVCDQLTIRRPTGADRRAVKMSDDVMKIQLARIARLTGLTDRHVDRLDDADIERIEAVIGNFS